MGRILAEIAQLCGSQQLPSQSKSKSKIKTGPLLLLRCNTNSDYKYDWYGLNVHQFVIKAGQNKPNKASKPLKTDNITI